MDNKTIAMLDSLWVLTPMGKLNDPANDRTVDRKRAFMGSDGNDGWKDIRIEIDTDDCDSQTALDSGRFIAELWNAWPEIRKELEHLNNPT